MDLGFSRSDADIREPSPEHPVSELLAASFDALARELPDAYARLCARLAGRVVSIYVDAERFVAAFAGGRAIVRPMTAALEPAADVRIQTSRRAILRVIDAERSLSEAVLADEVRVVGPLDRLMDLDAALVGYVHGAVRCPSFPVLLERLRGARVSPARGPAPPRPTEQPTPKNGTTEPPMSIERHLLNHTLAMALLSWSVHVFHPALALRRLGLYAPATLGVRPPEGDPRGGGKGLSVGRERPEMLPHEPEGYACVHEFDALSSAYEAVVRPFSDPIVDETIALMQPYLAPSARILDPSAGPGHAAIRLSRLVPDGEVIAGDLSRGMVEAAHRNALAAGAANMAFFQLDAARPPPAFDGYFDAIFCCLSFHHYEDGAAVAQAFRRVLAPHGKAFVADGGPAWFVELARPLSRLADPGFVRHRTGEEFLQLFAEAGFSSTFWIEALPGIGVTIASA